MPDHNDPGQRKNFWEKAESPSAPPPDERRMLYRGAAYPDGEWTIVSGDAAVAAHEAEGWRRTPHLPEPDAGRGRRAK